MSVEQGMFYEPAVPPTPEHARLYRAIMNITPLAQGVRGPKVAASAWEHIDMLLDHLNELNVAKGLGRMAVELGLEIEA